jgi:hypothetical protein
MSFFHLFFCFRAVVLDVARKGGVDYFGIFTGPTGFLLSLNEYDLNMNKYDSNMKHIVLNYIIAQWPSYFIYYASEVGVSKTMMILN